MLAVLGMMRCISPEIYVNQVLNNIYCDGRYDDYFDSVVSSEDCSFFCCTKDLEDAVGRLALDTLRQLACKGVTMDRIAEKTIFYTSHTIVEDCTVSLRVFFLRDDP